MATYLVRGNVHNIIYPYKREDGKTKQQWESYTPQLEAVKRKAYIDYLQKQKEYDELREAKQTEQDATCTANKLLGTSYQGLSKKMQCFHAGKKISQTTNYDSRYCLRRRAAGAAGGN